MKTPAFIIAVIFLSFAAAFPAQTKYSVPKNVAIESIVEEAFPSYFGHEYPQLIAENFFPIGWSRDGKFAYYVEPVDEACGCYFGRLVIQDMRTDKVLWEYRYSQDSEFDEKGEMSGSDSIDELWTKNAKLFSAKLSGHRIESFRRRTSNCLIGTFR